MGEIWFIKAMAFLPKLIAAIAGVILALVLSGDIDQDGYIKITRGVVLKFTIAMLLSLFGGSFIIDVWSLQYLSLYSQGFIFFMTAVFGLLSIGILYQSVAMMKGKPLGEVVAEVISAFMAIFSKGVK